MAIPGLKPTFDVRSKVRIGVKKLSAKGKEYPSSVDYFVCDDPAFRAALADQPRELRITFPYQSGEDCFSTGLEWWQGALLACYAKGDEIDGKPVALRKSTMKKNGKDIDLLAGTELLSAETVGNDRRKIVCPVRECPILKRKDCKPMGRLLFWIEGIEPHGGVFQLDTKSWNSVENIEKTMAKYPDLRGVTFLLRVSFTQRGTDRFPELYLEAEVDIDTPADVALADKLIQLDKAHVDGDEAGMRLALADVLDVTNPGWRENQAFIDRIKEVGILTATQGTLKRYLT